MRIRRERNVAKRKIRRRKRLRMKGFSVLSESRRMAVTPTKKIKRFAWMMR